MCECFSAPAKPFVINFVALPTYASRTDNAQITPTTLHHSKSKARQGILLPFIRFALFCMLSCSAFAETLSGRIVGISDGDTVTLLDAHNQQHKIRLAGIDAPEKSQAFGQRSKENLSQLVFDRTVQVDGNKTDRYGRFLGKIIVNGKDANLEQIRTGMAWHYKQYQNEQSPPDRRLYADAENQARQHRVGLWADGTPQPPWEFRHGGKSDANPVNGSAMDCPCNTATLCTGPKGGHYCLTSKGQKQYR